MITGSGYFSKTLQSLYYYLNNTQYMKDGSAVTLKGQYDNLDILAGFPDSLEQLSLPAVAIESNTSSNQEVSYGSTTKSKILSFSIYGFCGGKQTDGDNKALRNELCNDVLELLEDIDYIPLYDYPDFNSQTGDMSVESVVSRFLDSTGTLSAERFRFVIDLECEYVKSI